jgi:Ni/Co efflux regulator RcnB
MKRFPLIIAAAGSLALVAAPVAGASTSQAVSDQAAAQHQMAGSKIAQYQGSKPNNQEYNKQDTTKRKSWGGG